MWLHRQEVDIMDSEKVIKRDNEYVLHTYARNPIALEKGHGLYAEGPEGQKYLDFTSGIGVNSLGYCDMTWAEAVSEQAHKLQHTSNLYYTAPCGKLAKKLCKRTGMSNLVQLTGATILSLFINSYSFVLKYDTDIFKSPP